MTVPSERYRAVTNAKEFLRSLLDPKKTPRVPKSIRQQASWCLRHFPSDFDLDRAKDNYDDIFQSPEFEKHNKLRTIHISKNKKSNKC